MSIFLNKIAQAKLLTRHHIHKESDWQEAAGHCSFGQMAMLNILVLYRVCTHNDGTIYILAERIMNFIYERGWNKETLTDRMSDVHITDMDGKTYVYYGGPYFPMGNVTHSIFCKEKAIPCPQQLVCYWLHIFCHQNSRHCLNLCIVYLLQLRFISCLSFTFILPVMHMYYLSVYIVFTKQEHVHFYCDSTL